MYSFARDFTLVFWSLFAVNRVANNKIDIKMTAAQLLYAAGSSGVLWLLRGQSAILVPIAIIVLSCVFGKAVSKIKWGLAFTATVTSCGVSYAIFLLVGVFTSLIFTALNIDPLSGFIQLFCIFAVKGLFLHCLFKVKRFKKGFVFLDGQPTIVATVLVIVSVIIGSFLAFVSTVMYSDALGFYLFLPTLCIAISFIAIIIWWRKGITKTYKDGLLMKEVEEYKQEIIKKDERIQKLTSINYELAKIIHDDNKLLFAMETAVEEFLLEAVESNPELPALKEKAAPLLEQLRSMISERAGELCKYERENKRIPKTKIASVDTILTYFLQRAAKNRIDFNVVVHGNIRYLVETIISEGQLRTLIADLLDNAVIAVKPCAHKKILFFIGVSGEHYQISVSDNGIPFDKEVLQRLGREQVTSHKDSGGSGIGMMNAFEIFKETRASFEIEEYSERKYGFTKKIIAKFDGRAEIDL